MERNKLARVKYNDNYWLAFYTDFNRNLPKCEHDIQIVLEDNNGKKLDDAICHYGSYGVEQGLWEVMSGSLPKKHSDSGMGYLTWKQVEKYFDKTIRRLERTPKNK